MTPQLLSAVLVAASGVPDFARLANAMGSLHRQQQARLTAASAAARSSQLALAWYSVAAAQGHAFAQCRYGASCVRVWGMQECRSVPWI